MLSNDERIAERVLRRALETAASMRMDQSPPFMGREIHRMIREELGCADPYADLKKKSTRMALRLFDKAQRHVSEASDPFETAVRFAIAGNIMDFALSATWDEDRIQKVFAEALEISLNNEEVCALQNAVGVANSILYIGDNAGEVVLDRLLVKQMPAGKVVFGVRGSPVINDATRAEAEEAGLCEMARILESGSDAPGTILEICSDEFQRCFHEADVVIAKGQGNYESLSDVKKKNLFFLFVAKCPVTARDIGCRLGEFIITNNKRRDKSCQ